MWMFILTLFTFLALVAMGGYYWYTQMGYTLVKNTDYFGNDDQFLKGKTLDELKEACMKNKKCLGFNQKGYLKNKLQNQTSVDYDFYVKGRSLRNLFS